MVRILKWPGVCGILALVGLSSTATAQAPKAAAWIADDAIAYLEVVSPSTLLDRITDPRIKTVLETSPDYNKAINSAQLKEFYGVVQFVAGQLDTTWEKGVGELTGGGAVLAVEGRKSPERIVAIISPKDSAFLERAHAKLLELARNDAKEKGKPDPVTEKEYDGIKAYSLAPTEAHAIVEGCLVVTNGGETLKTIIDRAKGGKVTSITANDQWQARRKAAGPDALAFAFVRLDRLREIDPKKFGGGDGPPNAGATFLFGPWFEALRTADWISASISWTDGKLAAEVGVAQPKAGYSKAMARYLPSKGAGAPTLLNLPGTIASVSLWRDFSSIWEMRSEIFPPEAQQGLAQLDTTAGTFFGGRDFGTGVLGAISSDWRLVIARQDVTKLDPVPDVKLPAFALLIDIKPDDKEFATRLMSAFQTFIGLANLGAAQSKAPPLMLGSENLDGVTISTSKFVVSKDAAPAPKQPIDQRFNFSPSAAMVENHFIISSSLGLARELVKVAKSPSRPGDATLLAEVNGDDLAQLIDQNRQRLVMNSMLTKGNDKAKSEAEINSLTALARYLNHGRLSVADTDGGVRLLLNFDLKK
jgi:hypothetical protein